ncbi:MAG TPA: hypothetical protein VFX59_20335 [Polyangiales bacterium]|nr:hypothetical protein [Polyangiales bacterium]
MSHLQPEQALTLVTLAADDPERVQAYHHAESCPDCASLLREHEVMLQLLDASFEPAPVPLALAARVHARVYPRRWPRLVLLSVWLTSLALALGAGHAGVLAVGPGAHCALSEALFAVAPLGVGAWLSRAGQVRIDAASFALIAGGGGLVGQWWLRGHCPVHGEALHAFVFHFLVLLALSLLGGALGQRIVAART